VLPCQPQQLPASSHFLFLLLRPLEEEELLYHTTTTTTTAGKMTACVVANMAFSKKQNKLTSVA